MDSLTFLLSGTILAATPLLIAALGELIVEKSGVLNLSIEGMMALAAATGFIVVSATGSSTAVISSELLVEVMRARPSRPLLALDLAVPRDI